MIRSSNIVVIGGGAVGVQMATDIKELYPNKSVTLVHSRKIVMNKFHHGLHDIIEDRCRELGIDMRLGSRVKLPPNGYPTDGSQFDVELEDGSRIPVDFAVRLFLRRKLLSRANTTRSSALDKSHSRVFFKIWHQKQLTALVSFGL